MNSVSSGAQSLVVAFEGEPRKLAFTPEPNQPVRLDFPLEGVTAKNLGEALVLEAENGFSVQLNGMLGLDGGKVQLGDKAVFSNAFELMRHMALRAGGEEGLLAAAETAAEKEAGQEEKASEQVKDSPKPHEEKAADDEAQARDGRSAEAVVFSSGEGEYDSDAGDLLSSVDKYGKLGTFHWGDGLTGTILYEDKEDKEGDGSDDPLLTSALLRPGAPAIPNLELMQVDGRSYPAEHTVYESDPFGMRLEVGLSRVAVSGSRMEIDINGGTSVMSSSPDSPDGDYVHYSLWSLILPDGRVIPAVDCIRELEPGVLSVSLPLGVTSFDINIPLINDDITQGDRTFHYLLRDSGNYNAVIGTHGVITIKDESAASDIDPNWTPPVPGTPLPPDYVGPRGPIANIIVANAPGSFDASSATVLENDSAVTYHFTLDNISTGKFHIPAEDIRVVLKISGGQGFTLSGSGKDMGFDFSAFSKEFKNVSFNERTGEISFTIPKGWDAKPVPFTGTPSPNRPIELTEDLRIEVKSVVGNEAVPGHGVGTEVLDIPEVNVSASHVYISESPDHPDKPNRMDFVFTLSSPAPKDTYVSLDWVLGKGLTVEDFVVRSADGSLPSVIFIPKGASTVTVRIMAKDDAFSELNESLTVKILPENGVADKSNNYHVGKDHKATTTIVDDTDASRGTDNLLDGPVATIVLVDKNGNIIMTADGKNFATARDLPEDSGEFTYKVVLVKPGTATTLYTAKEDVTLTIQAEGLNGGSNLSFGTNNPSGNWDMAYPGFKPDGTYTLTIPKGENSSSTFTGKVNEDMVSPEAGEGAQLTIVKATGNETVAGHSVTDTVIDIPIVSITVDQKYYSESEPGMLFTIKATDGLAGNRIVHVKLTGEAGADLDYLISKGAIKGPNGEKLSYTVDKSGTDVIVSFKLPEGVDELKFVMPIKDDDIDEKNEKVTATIIDSTGSEKAYHIVQDGKGHTATTTIVDDTQDWNDKTYGRPEPGVHGDMDGPQVRIVLTDANGKIYLNRDGSFATLREVPEDSGDVYYKVVLVHPGTETLYTAKQDISFTVKAEGLAGLKGEGTDLSFGSGTPTGDWDMHFPQLDANGEITLTIPAGSNSTTTLIQAELNDDTISPEIGEGVKLSVKDVSGNEAVAGPPVQDIILDLPIVSVAVDKAYYSENESGMLFTLTASKELGGTRTVDVEISGGATIDLDFLVSGNGIITGPNGEVLTYSVGSVNTTDNKVVIIFTLPEGATELQFVLPIQDDKLDDPDETVKATVVNDSSTELEYHPNPDWTKSEAETTIIDDRQPWDPDTYGPAPVDGDGDPIHGSLDGPVVRIVVANDDGSPKVVDGKLVDDIGLPEGMGEVKYTVVLVDPVNRELIVTADEEITVTVKVEGLKDEDTDLDTTVSCGTDSPGSGWDISFPGMKSDGTITLTIPKDASSPKDANGDDAYFTGKLNLDRDSPESDEGIQLSITDVEGNEAIAGGPVTNLIVDVPVVSVSVGNAYYSEDDPGGMVFTLHSTRDLAGGTEIRVKVTGSALDPAKIDEDFLVGDGDADAGTNYITTLTLDKNGDPIVLEYTVTSTDTNEVIIVFKMPDGMDDMSELEFVLPIVNDGVSEENEGLTITVLDPDEAPADMAYVASGQSDPTKANSSNASTTIVDSTKEWDTDTYGPAPTDSDGDPIHGSLDGPRVAIFFEGSTAREGSVWEQGDNTTATGSTDLDHISYRISLVDNNANAIDTTKYSLTQATTVTIAIGPVGESLCGGFFAVMKDAAGNTLKDESGKDITSDYYFDKDAFEALYPPGAGYSISYSVNESGIGELTITMPPGKTDVVLDVKTVSDRFTEVDRYSYDKYGNPLGEDGKPVDENGDPIVDGGPEHALAKPDEAYNLTITKTSGNETSALEQYDNVFTDIAEKPIGTQVGIKWLDDVAQEEGQDLHFRLELSRVAEENVTVVLKVIPKVPADPDWADKDDFEGAQLTWVIEKGDKFADIDLSIFNDTFSENYENVEIEIIRVIGGEATIDEARKSDIGQIKDDGNGPRVSIEATGYTADTYVAGTDQVATDDKGRYTYHESEARGADGTDAPPVRPVYTVHLSDDAGGTQVPSEEMYITLKLGNLPSDPGVDVFWENSPEKWQNIIVGGDRFDDKYRPVVHDVIGNEIIIKVPAGFTGINDDGSFQVCVELVDDKYSENRESYTVSVTEVTGSEGKVHPDSGKTSVTTVIIDDTEIVQTEQPADPSTILDGYYVQIVGTQYISESGGKAQYIVQLVDKDGNLVEATQNITVNLAFAKYEIVDEDGNVLQRGADPEKDLEVEFSQVTIAAGTSSTPFYARIADDSFSEENETYTVTITGVSGNESMIREGKGSITTTIVDDTQEWKDAYNDDPYHVNPPGKDGVTPVHGANGAPLEGPVVTLTGIAEVGENVGRADYALEFSKVPVEDVTVTLCFSGKGDGFSIDDLMWFGSLSEEEKCVKLCEALNDLNKDPITGENLLDFTLVRIDDSDGEYHIYVTVVIDKTLCSAPIKISIFNDHLSEGTGNQGEVPSGREGFTLAIDSVTGSEAVKGDPEKGQQIEVDTTIVDDGVGQSVGILAHDTDPDDDKWGGEVTVSAPGNTAPFGFKLFVMAPDKGDYSAIDEDSKAAEAVEPIYVTITLFGADGGPAYKTDASWPRIKYGPGDDDYCDAVVTDGVGYYTLTIPKGQHEFEFTVPNENSGKYQYLVASIVKTVMGESLINPEASYAAVEFDPGGSGGYDTCITLEGVKHTGEPYAEEGRYPGLDYFVKEGANAEYLIKFSGDDHLNEFGKLQYATTLTLILRGTGDNAASPGADFLDAFAAQNGHLTDVVWDSAKGTLSITIPEKTDVSGGIKLNVPVDLDAKWEGTEFYTLALTGVKNTDDTTQSAGKVNRNPVEFGIIDETAGPVLSIAHKDDVDTVTEGGSKYFRIYMDMPNANDKFTSPFTIQLEYDAYTTGGVKGAEPNADFVPSPQTLWFAKGVESGWNSDDGGKTWYYDFPVKIPDDQYSEVNEHFSVTVSVMEDNGIKVVPANDSKGRKATAVTTIEDDGESGPEVWLNAQSMTIQEKDGGANIEFEVVMDHPAVENVVVTFKLDVTDGVWADKYDFSAYDTGPKALPGEPYFYQSGGEYYLDVVVPTGMVQEAIKLKGVIVNNKLTDDGRTITFEMIDTHGGETSVAKKADGDPRDDTKLEVKVTDKIDGSDLIITASESTLYEGGKDGVADDLVNTVFTFKLPNGELASENITFKVRLKSSNDVPINQVICDPLNPDTPPAGGYYEFTITIPKDSNSATLDLNNNPTLKLALKNDGIDNSAGKGFYLEVVSGTLKGSEARYTGGKVTVDVVDDDHTPVAVNDKIVIMLDQANKGVSVEANLVRNDTDADDDTLTVAGLTGQNIYGSHALDGNKLTYTVNENEGTVAHMSQNEELGEKTLTYTVTDGDNTHTAKVDVAIQTITKYTGSGNAEWVFGSGLDETIDGGGGLDVVYAGDGKDKITVNGDGLAELHGDEGDDTFTLSGTGTLNLESFVKGALALIDGGDDKDTIKLGGSGITLNATATGDDADAYEKITNIEVLDISSDGKNANTLVLGDDALAKLTTTLASGEYLFIDGVVGDKISFADSGWNMADAGDQTKEGYVLYTNGTQSVWVNAHISRVITGTDNADTLENATITDIIEGGKGDDTITLYDRDNDNELTDKDFAKVSGGEGTDTVKLASGDDGGKAFTLSAFGGGLESIEVIDFGSAASASDPNSLLLDAETIKALNGESGLLRVDGSYGDQISFAEAGWEVDTSGTESGYVLYKYTDGTQVLVKDTINRVVTGTDFGTNPIENTLATDILQGTGNGDTFLLKDVDGTAGLASTDFAKVLGGDGTDTVKLASESGVATNFALEDFRANLESIECINFTSAGNSVNTLELDADSIAGLAASPAVLRIVGREGDLISFKSGEGWEVDATYTESPDADPDYVQYKSDDGTLVQVHIAVSRVVTEPNSDSQLENTLGTDVLQGATDAANTFLLKDVAGSEGLNTPDGKLTTEDFEKVRGGDETDTIILSSGASGGMTFNLTDFSANLESIESIRFDSPDSDGNHLTLGTGFADILGTDVTKLHIGGTANDSFSLEGDGWTEKNNGLAQQGEEGSEVFVYSLGDESIEVEASLSRLIKGQDGDGESLSAHTAQDVVVAGNGDDVVTLENGVFRSLDGGDGFDVLRIESGTVLDFTDGSLGSVINFDMLDLGKDAEITLDAQSIRAITGVTDTAESTTLKVEAVVEEITPEAVDAWLKSTLHEGYESDWDITETDTEQGRTLEMHNTADSELQLFIVLHTGS